jgi:Holliday junction resolvasome RuvABC endonuclease subunit
MKPLNVTTIKPPAKLKNLIMPYWTTNRAIFFDVSTKSTGWAAWDYETGFVRYGALQADRKASTLERICQMSSMTHRLLNELKITTSGIAVFIEEGIGGGPLRISTALVLGEARGAIMTAIRDRATVIEEIGNDAWKKYLRVLTDEKSQKGEKIQAHRNIEAILQTSVSVTHYGKEATYDESDAIGGLIYALCNKQYEEE